MHYEYDVVIGGAGITGLYAGLYFLGKGFRTCIIEKSDEIGGRIQTIRRSPTISYEAGAGRFNLNHVRLLKLLRAYGLGDAIAPISTEKQYRSVATPATFTSPASAITRTLDRVIAFSKTQAARDLKQMTFEALCKRVLGDEAALEFKNAFGYNAEFELMNAFDALRTFERDFNTDSQYFYCKGGLSQLTRAMHSDFIAKGGSVFMREAITDISTDPITVRTTRHNLRARTVILTFPQSSLLSIPSFTDAEKALLESVAPVPLTRIYAAFSSKGTRTGTAWFEGIPKTSTDLPLRQVIPINPATGLIMASYSDTHYATEWAALSKSSTRRFKTKLVQQLERLFPERASLPPLPASKVFVHHWPEGVHVWKVGADSARLYRRIMQIKGPTVPLFIIGETFSKNQGWIEGGLDMFHDALPKLRPFLT